MEYVSVVTEIDDVNNPIVGVNGWVQLSLGGSSLVAMNSSCRSRLLESQKRWDLICDAWISLHYTVGVLVRRL